MAEENAMAWVERVGINLGHRCHILLETNLVFWVSCGCHARLPPHFQDKNQCWAAGEVSHVLTTLANEVAGPLPWIWHESALEHSHCSPARGRELSGLSERWPGSLGQMQSTRCRSFESGYSDVFVEVQELEKNMYLAYWLFVLLLFPLPGNSDPHDWDVRGPVWKQGGEDTCR
jgi:hypothetical protein